MGKTSIEWTDYSWNPIRARNIETGKIGWHCEHKSDGCRFCYAETFNRRLGTGLDFKPGHRKNIEIFLDEKMLLAPLKWKAPRKIFVCSMTDLAADFVSDDMLDRIFAIAALCPQHTFIVLTKRPERMREYISACVETFHASPDSMDRRFGEICVNLTASPCAAGAFEDVDWPLQNVWLGTSCEDQDTADERIPHLLGTPAAVRFLSCEPLLGAISLEEIPTLNGSSADILAPECWGDCACDNCFGPDPGCRRNGGDGRLTRRIDWVIAGGESGSNARPMHPDWVRSLRDQCAAADVPFFFKQWGEWAPRDQWSGHLGSGRFERMVAIMPDGSECSDDVAPQDVGAHRMARVGKLRAGRLLDGVEHNGFPERVA